MSKAHHSRSKASSVERKLSVFERLGSKSSSNSKSKNASKKIYADDESLEKFDRPRDEEATRYKGAEMKKAMHGKKVKDKHRKQQNVHGETPESNDLDLDLEGADEKFLQKRRQQLQRELRLQLKREKTIGVKQPKKVVKKAAVTSSSGSSTDSSSSSSSSSSSYADKRNIARKRKPSVSSGSESPTPKRKKIVKPVAKAKIEIIKKKPQSPRKIEAPKKILLKKSMSPNWERRASPVKKKSPPRVKPRPPVVKPKPREPSPKRIKKSKERRITPPVRPARPRSPDRRRHNSPRPRHGGLEKGGKILPVKSLAYAKEMKETMRRKTPDRVREDKEKEKERIKERRRRELKAREVERREREREAERLKREAERQKERDEALARSRDRQRERERLERIDREKRTKDYDRKEMESRKADIKNDLPSLLDIKTEAPREPARRGWDERRGRRGEDGFEYRHAGREDLGSADERRRGYDGKWPGEGSGRDASWREHYPARRTNEARSSSYPKDESRLEERSTSGDHSKRTTERTDESRPNEPPAAERKKELDEALSDISDDADDILNQEEPVPEPVDPTPAQLLPVALSQPSAEFFFDSRRPLLECLGDRLDFEEISDEELEEEAKMGRGIMDVLGADWASLMSQTCVKPHKTETASSARRRWRADSIIARIGISRNLAGQDFADRFMNRIQTQTYDLDEEKGPEKNLDADNVKQEKCESLNFLHRLPAVHAMLQGLSDPSPIFRILNSNKHALSARSDLSIRRVACGFAPKESLQLTSMIDDNLYEANVAIVKSAAA